MKSYRITVSISHDPCSLATELVLCNLLEVEPNTAHSVSSNAARDSPYASTKSNSLSLPSYRGLILLMLLELSAGCTNTDMAGDIDSRKSTFGYLITFSRETMS
ncbi:hypothetical protein CK203_016738 [Vitis vinifera]|uniref:Uncharacterized protein n=1 Tax=Vitis vinifera TaxID=29760 RepID=A0A438J2J0_VITVI|nr:hypothetical protein CK203_016738 [Vitis vinifera]